MDGIFLFAAALLFADPQSFLLTESREHLLRALGPPAMVADFGQDFQSWQYESNEQEEFSLMVVFRKSTGKLVSVTRGYEPERNVDELFPEAETTAHHFNPQYGLRLRRLSGGRVLMAMGAPKRGQLTGQLVLMRESELPYFYPWLKVGEPEADRVLAPGPAR